MRIPKYVSYLSLALAAFTAVSLVNSMKPTSIRAFAFFAAWLLFPYALMFGSLVLLQRRRSPSLHWYVTVAVVSIGGTALLLDIVVLRPDPQGAIAVLLVPLVQCFALALLVPILKRAFRNAGA